MDLTKELEKLALEYNDIINKINEITKVLNQLNIRKIEIEGAIKTLNALKIADEEENKPKTVSAKTILNESIK